MIQAHYTRTIDRIGWQALAWRTYLLCVGTSFLVIIEPAPTDLFFVLALGMMLLAGVRPVRLLGPVETVAILMFVWFTLLSLSSDSLVNMGAAVRAAGIQFYLMLLFLMTAYFAHIAGDRAFRVILIALTIGSLIAAILGVLAYLGLIPESLRWIFFRDGFQTRVRSTFKDPNVLGPYLIPATLFAMWVMISVERFRLRAGIAFGILLFCVMVTYSRGAWVHLAITMLIFGTCLLINRRTALSTMGFTLGLVIALLTVGAVFGQQIADWVDNSYLGSRLALQEYDDHRFDAMLLSFDWIAEDPFGLGPNQVAAVHGRFPHNTLLNLATNNGVFAALGFLLLFLATAWRCLVKTLQQEPGWMKYAFILSIMAGLALLMNVVPALHWRHIYVVLGLAYGQYRSNAIF